MNFPRGTANSRSRGAITPPVPPASTSSRSGGAVGGGADAAPVEKGLDGAGKAKGSKKSEKVRCLFLLLACFVCALKRWARALIPRRCTP